MKKNQLLIIMIIISMIIAYEITVTTNYKNNKGSIKAIKKQDNKESISTYSVVDVNSYINELKIFKDIKLKKILFREENYEVLLEYTGDFNEIISILNYVKENNKCNLNTYNIVLVREDLYNLKLDLIFQRKEGKKSV